MDLVRCRQFYTTVAFLLGFQVYFLQIQMVSILGFLCILVKQKGNNCFFWIHPSSPHLEKQNIKLYNFMKHSPSQTPLSKLWFKLWTVYHIAVNIHHTFSFLVIKILKTEKIKLFCTRNGSIEISNKIQAVNFPFKAIRKPTKDFQYGVACRVNKLFIVFMCQPKCILITDGL